MSDVAKKLSRFSQTDVKAFFSKARAVIRSSRFVILFAPKQEVRARILIVTSRKVGCAVKRNKLRRRLRSIFYEQRYYERDFDCGVIAKKGATEASFDQLTLLLAQAFERGIR